MDAFAFDHYPVLGRVVRAPLRPSVSELAATLPDTLARMRSLCPVARSENYGGFWVVTEYEDVLRVAQDWETFSSAHGLTVPPSPIAVRNIPVEVDPPLHRTYKRLINAYFTPAAVVAVGAGNPCAGDPADRRLHRARAPASSWIRSPGRSRLGRSSSSRSDAPRESVEKVADLASKSSTPNDPEAAECWPGCRIGSPSSSSSAASAAPRRRDRRRAQRRDRGPAHHPGRDRGHRPTAHPGRAGDHRRRARDDDGPVLPTIRRSRPLADQPELLPTRSRSCSASIPRSSPSPGRRRRDVELGGSRSRRGTR